MNAAPAPHLLDATMFWNASGGVRRYVIAKREFALQQMGWRHTVATPTPDQPDQLRLPSLPLPGSGGAYRLPWQRAALADLLCRAEPDLIESADPYRLAWAALDAADRRSVPALAFCHSNLEQVARLAAGGCFAATAGRVAARYAARLYRRFDRVLAPSHAMTAHLRSWGVGQAMHQPLGVDCALFDPGRADPAWRASLGLPAQARLLVYAGRFAPEKNLNALTGALERLGPRYWMLAIGAGPAPPDGERVIVQPVVRDARLLAAMIASCDLFVHAGAQETFGLSALEALACGLPLVARAAEGLRELVSADVGRGVDSDAAAAFAEAIDDVFSRDRLALTQAARERALQSDWDRVLPLLWQHYRQLLGTSPRSEQ